MIAQFVSERCAARASLFWQQLWPSQGVSWSVIHNQYRNFSILFVVGSSDVFVVSAEVQSTNAETHQVADSRSRCIHCHWSVTAHVLCQSVVVLRWARPALWWVANVVHCFSCRHSLPAQQASAVVEKLSIIERSSVQVLSMTDTETFVRLFTSRGAVNTSSKC